MGRPGTIASPRLLGLCRASLVFRSREIGGQIRNINRGEKDIGWVENFILFESKREKEIKFNINPIFFLDILSKTDEMKVGEDCALFKIKNFQHLMALWTDNNVESEK